MTYPNSIDDSTTLPLVFDNITEVTASTVNPLRNAIIAIETALGINPQGTYTLTGGVRARLDNIDTQITNLNTAVANVITEVDAIIAGLDGEQIKLGTPSGGFNPVGITTLQNTTPITEAINTFNNIMAYLAPAQPHSMQALAIDAVTSLPLFAGNIAHNGAMAAGYYGTFAAGGPSAVITKTQVFTLTTHNTGDATTGFSDADKGIITLELTNSDNTGNSQLFTTAFNLGVAFDSTHAADLAGQGVTYDGNTGSASPPLKVISSLFQIYSIALFNGFPLWQKGVARITNTTLTSGYNKFDMTHFVGSLRTSQNFPLFFDDGYVTPAAFSGTPTLVVAATSHVNWLSGIRFLSTGTGFLTVGATINNTFKNTYSATPLSYTFTVGTVSALNTPLANDSSLSGFTGHGSSSPVPDVSEHITINKGFDITIVNQQTINLTTTITYTDVYGNTYSGTSGSNNILINTYNTPASTNSTDTFVDEFYRLLPNVDGGSYPNDYSTSWPISVTGNWTSTASLSNGNAQVYDAQLTYPNTNFSTGYSPSQTPDYSGFTGNQVYYRAMYSPGNPRSTGTLTIGGIVLSDLGTNVKAEIRLPGTLGTGWLDLGLPFNNGTFTGITGDGCRSGNSGDIFGWSAGTFTTGDTGFMYILRLTLLTSNKSITSLIETFTQTF